MEDSNQEEHYKIQVENDHLKKICGATTVNALAELIWNSLDADARNVQVVAMEGELGSSALTVRDDGHGIPRDVASEMFSKLGGSWKKNAGQTKTLKRALHGQEGKGRFKALSLGRVADWTVTNKTKEGFSQYTITMIADDPKDVRISQVNILTEGAQGVYLRISECSLNTSKLGDGSVAQELTELFAPYLTNYSDANVTVFGSQLDPSKAIAAHEQFALDEIVTPDGSTYPASLDVFEWNTASTQRALYLCSLSGLPLKRLDSRIHTPANPDFNFSAYLKSAYNEKLREGDDNLDLAELHGPLNKARDEAIFRIKEFAAQRASSRAESVIDEWKRENVYPFKGEARDPVETVRRKVFDKVALAVQKHLPSTAEAPQKVRALQMQLLRDAIERGPQELQPILLDVLKLTVREQRELNALLQETSLAAIIKATRVITDRIKFLSGLKFMVFNQNTRKLLKERSQLHRLLAANTWIFGEEYNLSVDDQSLTEALSQHKKLLGDPIVIDKPVAHSTKKRGILDLMLSRKIKGNRIDDIEHLVVELKRPAVKISGEETIQIERYALAVAKDERFKSLNTRWEFVVISNDLDEYAQQRASQKDAPKGRISSTENPNITVWVKTWAEVFAENEHRLQFYQQTLAYEASHSKAVEFLQANYSELDPLKESMQSAAEDEDEGEGEGEGDDEAIAES